MAQVSGKVQYIDGSPIVGGIRIIRLEPDDDTPAVVRKTASGEIADDGSFTLMTKRPGDGVYKGNYIATFTILESPRSAESLAPAKYSSYTDSPIEITIDGNRDDLLIELDKK